MDREKAHPSRSGIVFGTLIMLLGAIFLIGRLTPGENGALHLWWPLILVGLGVSKVWEAWGTLQAGSGAWLTFVGLWLLAVNFKLLGLTFGNSWPLLLVAVGGSMIWKSTGGRGESPAEEVRDER